MKTGIYKITNLVNKKFIIGSGILDTRKRDHFNKLRKNKHCNYYLQEDFNIYGEENFIWEVLEECEHELCISRELYYVLTLNSRNREVGYNIELPGKSRLGIKLSEEHKEKIRQANTGKPSSRKGIPLTEEHKKKIGLGNKGKGGILGRKWTPEFREFFIKKVTGHIVTEETRQKISNSKKGQKMPESMKEKLRGRKKDPDVILKTIKANQKPVLQYTLEGEFIREFESIKEAALYVGLKGGNSLVSYLKDKENRKQCGGFKWEYKLKEI